MSGDHLWAVLLPGHTHRAVVAQLCYALVRFRLVHPSQLLVKSKLSLDSPASPDPPAAFDVSTLENAFLMPG